MDEEILKTAKSVCGCTQEEEEVLERLCAACAKQVESRLRAGIEAEDCEGAFICASAWLAAAAMLETTDGAEELSSLRAGDVTLTLRGGERAEMLRRSAWRLMEPYTEGGDFYFCGVRG